MKLKKMTAAILAGVMALGVLAGCSGSGDTPSGNSTQDISTKKQLVMGMDVSFPPMGFRDENNEITGFDVEMAKAVCEKLGWEFKAQPIDWTKKEMELENGSVDVLWNGFSATEERREKMLLSDPYLENHQIIVVRKDSEIQSKADLEGKIVALQKDSSAEPAFQADDISGKIKELVTFSDNVAALNDLKIGRTDAVVVDEVVANYYTQKDDSFRIVNDSFVAEEYVIGFKKGNEALKEKVMGAFDELVADGTASKLSEKWFGKDIIIKK